MRKRVVGVMGAGERAADADNERAFRLGALIAQEGWVLLSGGRNAGVMDAVSRGARSAQGLTVGIVPGADTSQLSDAVDIAIVTGMGSARNAINVLSSDIVIACGEGGAGTASEIALALKSKKHVILFNASMEAKIFFKSIGKELIHTADTPEEAVAIVKKYCDAL